MQIVRGNMAVSWCQRTAMGLASVHRKQFMHGHNKKDGGCPTTILSEPKHSQLGVIPPKTIIKNKTCSQDF